LICTSNRGKEKQPKFYTELKITSFHFTRNLVRHRYHILYKKKKQNNFLLNFNKCEIFCCSGDTDLKVIKEFQNLAPGIKIGDREGLSLLGSPIFDQGYKNTVEKTIIIVENLLNKAELLNRHVAYTLIKNCLFIPKFNFLLRTTPFWKFSNYVNSIDSSLKSCLERILNLRLTDLQWRQSTLPIRFGGLGIRRISDICLPAFLSSINGVKKLVSLLLNSKNWDNINIKRIIAPMS
jgi:hypothetical protein